MFLLSLAARPIVDMNIRSLRMFIQGLNAIWTLCIFRVSYDIVVLNVMRLCRCEHADGVETPTGAADYRSMTWIVHEQLPF